MKEEEEKGEEDESVRAKPRHHFGAFTALNPRTLRPPSLDPRATRVP